jgi:hypothetical protein
VRDRERVRDRQRDNANTNLADIVDETADLAGIVAGTAGVQV